MTPQEEDALIAFLMAETRRKSGTHRLLGSLLRHRQLNRRHGRPEPTLAAFAAELKLLYLHNIHEAAARAGREECDEGASDRS
jgi:hypothetical protein